VYIDIAETNTGKGEKTMTREHYHVSRWGNQDETIPEHIAELEDKLPHGSGIDSDWHFDETSRMVRATNTYSAMDDFGGYCHDYTFTVNIPKRAGIMQLDQFRVTMGREYVCCGYGVKMYLEDTIAGAV
jgi:hypothetical protein